MVSFIAFDLTLLVLFTIFIIVFLYIKRKNVIREGIIFLYRTQLGMKIMNNIGDKYKRTLKAMAYPIIIVGYLLMIGIVWLLVQVTYYYVRFPEISQLIKAPPIIPLIPYFPQLFGLEAFFPNFYFVHFIVAIALVAIFHEGFHGIYARMHKVRIKSTGFLFLGPLLGFFVEQDDKDMAKRKIFPQLQILGAGVFSNVMLGVIFFIVLAAFFQGVYVPSGAVFNDYSPAIIPVALLGNATITDERLEINGLNLTRIELDNRSFLISGEFNVSGAEFVRVYQDQPAIRAGFRGAITNVDGTDIKNHQDLSTILSDYKPGDEISIKTIYEGEDLEYDLVLGTDYSNESRAVLGVSVTGTPTRGFRGVISKIVSLVRDPTTYYETKFDRGAADFIYLFVGWIVIINILIAFANMLPVGIFDGGRFWYLTVLALTKSEKTARRAYKTSTWLILALLAALMAVWLFRILSG